MKQFCAKFMKVSGDKLFSCGLGHGGCVDAYGNFQPCMLLRHPSVVYNLRRGSLREAVVDFFPRLKEMKAQNPDYLARCSLCFLHGLCEQCPSKSWMEHGTLDTPVDYFCQVAHSRALDLGLLREGEWAWEIEDWMERIKTFIGQ
jgi:radical SAM protein with 4Fe4S-binding SPASM domain